MRQHIEKKQSALFRALLPCGDRTLKQSQKKIAISSGFARACFGIIVLAFALCFAVSAPAYAGLAVSVSGGNWAIGTVAAGGTEETTGDTYTVTNDSSTGSSIYIKVEGTNWDPGSSAGEDTFVLTYDTAGSWSSAVTDVDNGLILATLASGGTQTFDLQFTAPTTDTAGGEQTLTVTLTATKGWVCGDGLAISHTAGDISPVSVGITYGTWNTDLSGATKCWITQNLGATQQASSATDNTDASAGWYWQFNRKQGYAVGPSPAWSITSIDENSGWSSANDPCVLLLGSSWRIPTTTEWTTADSGEGWDNYNETYSSVLKLHAAGFLAAANGALDTRGTYGFYWSSTQGSSTSVDHMYFHSTNSFINDNSKALGCSVRCLKDPLYEDVGCGGVVVINHTAGTISPETINISYGTVSTDLSGATKCWITQNLGASHQAPAVNSGVLDAIGWYWQFNRKQGFAIGPTPAWVTNSIDEDSDWTSAEDPCTQLLGAGWRLPTYTELNTVASIGTNWDNIWNSVLKLHTCGRLATDGELVYLSSRGYFCQSTQHPSTFTLSWQLYIGSIACYLNDAVKAGGYSVRCLKD